LSNSIKNIKQVLLTNFSKFVFFLIAFSLFFVKIGVSQTPYDNCNNALEICPNTDFDINNIDATKTFCANCDDNFSFCFTANNTIWLKFTSNELGGQAQLDFSNLEFESNPNQGDQLQATILRALAPCDATTYTAVGNCVSNATTNFSLTANLLPSTEYYVVVNGARNGGTTIPAEARMNINLHGVGVDRPFPFISLSYPDSLCQNEIATLSASILNCPDSTNFSWFINGDLVALTPSAVFQTSALKNNDVITFSTSCFSQCAQIKSESSLPIFVESFLVDAGEDKFISPGEAVELNGTSEALINFWTPSFAISNPTTLNPIVSPEITTSYFLTGEKNSCLISDEVIVHVDLKLEIYNTFTPNGDGFNDTWEIPGLILYPNCLVQIFDRWGQLVFSSTGYNAKKAWDGTINDKKANESVYFYSIDLRDGSSRTFKGSVSLIR
jgi:gliding motility-associated-like protein